MHRDQTEDFDAFAKRVTPLQGRQFADFTEWERDTYRKAHHNLHASPEAVISLARAVDHIVGHDIPGAFIECGVYMGGNIEVMIRALNRHRVNTRDIYLYDTFAGMPEPQAVDDEGLPDRPVRTTWEQFRTAADGAMGSAWMRASTDVVKARIKDLGYPWHRLHFVKGMVEDTIPDQAPERIALLRLDTDFYSSTRHELVHLYPRLSSKGILIIDDYGAMPGSKKATDEYLLASGLPLFLNRVDAHVRMLIKP